jgi:exodeoxyribonuclease VII large subunit
MSRSGRGDLQIGEPGDIYTVSEITEAIRQHLETEFPDIMVIGEIANFKAHSSGHYYFSLRDGSNFLRIVLFKRYAEGIGFMPENGQLVVAAGRISHYGGSGQTQLIARSLRVSGRGMMEVEYTRLLGKLMGEGLTAPERKRPIPAYPRRVVVITSPTGAVIRDIVDTIRRRWPLAEIIHIGVDVQGIRAENSIVRSFEISNSLEEVDVVILARGGGSMEELWVFNLEKVARAVASSRHPVITGIGHEIDTTVSDYVSDLRASTPAAAAELATPLAEEVKSLLDERVGRIVSLCSRSSIERLRLLDYLLMSGAFPSIVHRLDRAEYSLSDLTHRLEGCWEEKRALSLGILDSSGMRLETSISRKLRACEAVIAERLERLPDPGRRLYASMEALKRLVKILGVRMDSAIALRRGGLSERTRTLAGMHPLDVLRRGYTVCTDPSDERILSRSVDIAAGDNMMVHFYDGDASCTVDEKRKGMPWPKRRASRKP